MAYPDLPHLPRFLRPLLEGYAPAIRRARDRVETAFAGWATDRLERELYRLLDEGLAVDRRPLARWQDALARQDETTRRGWLLDLMAALAVLEAEGLVPSLAGADR